MAKLFVVEPAASSIGDEQRPDIVALVTNHGGSPSAHTVIVRCQAVTIGAGQRRIDHCQTLHGSLILEAVMSKHRAHREFGNEQRHRRSQVTRDPV